jgi:hypothetical protein
VLKGAEMTRADTRNVLIGGVVFATVMAVSITLFLPSGPVYTALGMAIAFVAMRLTWNIRPDRIPTAAIVGKTAALGAVMFAMIYGIQRVAGPFFVF